MTSRETKKSKSQYRLSRKCIKLFIVIWCDTFAGDILWLEGLNVQRTEMILAKLAKMLYEWVYEEQSVSRETIYGIEILNEPWGRY